MTTRAGWATDHLTWATRWQKIVFSDEKKFNLDGPDGWASYYHDVRKPELLHNKRHTGGGGVMIWAAIGWRGKSDLAFIQGNMNSEAYQAVLRDHLLPHGARIGGARWIFMQDNASIHRSHSTRAWLQDHNVRVLPWPARSPDMNPIENMWGMLARLVYASGKQYSNVEELKTAITAKWAEIGAEYRRGLYNSMHSRMEKVIEAGGKITKY
jgi:hypothetical protein